MDAVTNQNVSPELLAWLLETAIILAVSLSVGSSVAITTSFFLAILGMGTLHYGGALIYGGVGIPKYFARFLFSFSYSCTLILPSLFLAIIIEGAKILPQSSERIFNLSVGTPSVIISYMFLSIGLTLVGLAYKVCRRYTSLDELRVLRVVAYCCFASLLILTVINDSKNILFEGIIFVTFLLASLRVGFLNVMNRLGIAQENVVVNPK